MDRKQSSKKKSNSKKRFEPKKIVKALWLAFAGAITLSIIIFTLIATGIIGYMPPIHDLANPIDKYASQLYSSDGEMMGTYSLKANNRIYSDFTDLSPYLVDALVATEDARYYSHSGIDAYALTRAVIKRGIFQDKSGGGGSTISQQLAKLLYSEDAEDTRERLLQKPIEWVIAVKLERYYTKQEIINLYLNKFDFLYNAVGIQSAAHIYFDKKPKDLKIEEAATLIGMCKNPSYFNPVRKPERTQGRRNVVLEQMCKYGYISQQECDSLKNIPLTLKFRRVDHKDGVAPYFREYLRMIMNAKKPTKSNYENWQMTQYTIDSLNWESNPLYGWCNKNKKPDGSKYNLATDGLKIYTTIDARMQRYAEEAVIEHMSKEIQPAFDREKRGRSYAPFSSSYAKNVDSLLYRSMKVTDRYRNLKREGMSDKEIYKIFKQPVDMKVFSWRGEIDTTMTPLDSIRYHKRFLRAGFMAMDTHSGFVKAYVGGINYNYFKYDMVNTGRRQVGSTIKPYLYTLAMDEGMTPCDQMLYEQQTLLDELGRPYSPRGLRASKVGEMVSIKWGLQASDNMVTTYLMGKTTPYAFARLLRSFGLTGHIDPVVAMALGTPEVTVSEMAAAYTSFANKGLRATPIYVTHIEDSHGNIIATFTPKLTEVFSESTYAKMLDMLRGVIDGGTGNRLRRNYGLTGPIGGKTGTTQKNADGWFMGFTPNISAGCWVGGEDPSIYFDRTNEGQGASMALPIFGLFLKKIYADPKIEYKQTDQFPAARGASICGSQSDEDVLETAPTVGIDNMFN